MVWAAVHVKNELTMKAWEGDKANTSTLGTFWKKVLLKTEEVQIMFTKGIHDQLLVDTLSG